MAVLLRHKHLLTTSFGFWRLLLRQWDFTKNPGFHRIRFFPDINALKRLTRPRAEFFWVLLRSLQRVHQETVSRPSACPPGPSSSSLDIVNAEVPGQQCEMLMNRNNMKGFGKIGRSWNALHPNCDWERVYASTMVEMFDRMTDFEWFSLRDGNEGMSSCTYDCSYQAYL